MSDHVGNTEQRLIQISLMIDRETGENFLALVCEGLKTKVGVSAAELSFKNYFKIKQLFLCNTTIRHLINCSPRKT